MEGGLAKTDAQAFEEAMEASKTHVIRLIQEVSEAEDIYDSGEAKFDKILASVAEEVKVYIQQQGATQRATYKRKCLDRIRQDHGRLDGTCFVPMIVGNSDRPPRTRYEPTGGAVARAFTDNDGALENPGWSGKGVHEVHRVPSQTSRGLAGETRTRYYRRQPRI